MSELYRRAMGLPYNEERLVHEAANGLSGHGHEVDQELAESNAGELSVGAPLSEYANELQGLHMILAETDLSFEERIVFEAEEVVLAEQLRLEELALRYPTASAELKRLLTKELRARKDAGQPVDDEMFAETEILGEYIAEANEGASSTALVKIAVEMKAVIEAQRQCNEIHEHFALAS